MALFNGSAMFCHFIFWTKTTRGMVQKNKGPGIFPTHKFFYGCPKKCFIFSLSLANFSPVVCQPKHAFVFALDWSCRSVVVGGGGNLFTNKSQFYLLSIWINSQISKIDLLNVVRSNKAAVNCKSNAAPGQFKEHTGLQWGMHYDWSLHDNRSYIKNILMNIK